MANTVTTLFLMDDKPVHAGVYKLNRLDGSPLVWAYWNAFYKMWCRPVSSVEESVSWPGATVWELPGAVIGWRGLAEKPA